MINKEHDTSSEGQRIRDLVTELFGEDGGYVLFVDRGLGTHMFSNIDPKKLAEALPSIVKEMLEDTRRKTH